MCKFKGFGFWHLFCGGWVQRVVIESLDRGGFLGGFVLLLLDGIWGSRRILFFVSREWGNWVTKGKFVICAFGALTSF